MKPRIALLALAACAGATEISEGPRSIIELQDFRQSQSIRIRSRSGSDGIATLINLNPAINAWYVLKIAWAGQAETAYQIENPSPRSRRLRFDEKYPAGVAILEGNSRSNCDLFGSSVLKDARASSLIYAPLCDGRIYLRNPAVGHRTSLEAATDFLRDHVWGAEKIISVGHVLLGDAHRETGEVESGSGINSAPQANEAPLPALIDSAYTREVLASNNFGIALAQPQPGGMLPGAWYAAAGNPGVYVSILRPNLISPAILESYKSRVNYLDGAEASALCYLIAFDLDRFDLGYALGTEHPKVGWSEHIQAQMRDPKLPGPDGIGTIAPLVATGLIAPEYAPRTISAFTAGFKREHGAFKYGELALKNHGTHYGFIENGVVFSKLQPGLSTVFVLDDGAVGMQTWTDDDNRLLPRIKHARQNGVPIVERDPESQSTVPGALVKTWGPGNWSGSEDVKLRTMRSGLAIGTNGRKRFLIYAVFSSATPSAMARVFQAYRCDYAMLLDMNALEHTYLALYRRAGSQMYVDHLVKGMSELDKTVAGEIVPRFLGYADNRDFFYVMRKEGKP
jgi:hypothetical protein